MNTANPFKIQYVPVLNSVFTTVDQGRVEGTKTSPPIVGKSQTLKHIGDVTDYETQITLINHYLRNHQYKKANTAVGRLEYGFRDVCDYLNGTFTPADKVAVQLELRRILLLKKEVMKHVAKEEEFRRVLDDFSYVFMLKKKYVFM